MLAALLAVILAAAPAKPPPAPSAPANIERASAEDCAVILAVGRSQLGWGAKPPEFAFFPEVDQDGGKTFVEECPWKAMGVAAPRIGTPQSENGFWISRPVFDRTRTTASADMTRTIVAMENQGEPMNGFLETRTCSLRKRDGRWQVVACRSAAVT
jgi:hypothetical protein